VEGSRVPASADVAVSKWNEDKWTRERDTHFHVIELDCYAIIGGFMLHDT
jgi:hypothetical protein